MFVQFRAFHCPSCNKCCSRWEKHSYLHNRCISANNLPLYYLHCWIEWIHAVFIGYLVSITFSERIDKELLFFLLYLITTIGYVGIFTKKIIVHSKSILTNSSLWERDMGGKLHYRMKK